MQHTCNKSHRNSLCTRVLSSHRLKSQKASSKRHTRRDTATHVQPCNKSQRSSLCTRVLSSFILAGSSHRRHSQRGTHAVTLLHTRNSPTAFCCVPAYSALEWFFFLIVREGILEEVTIQNILQHKCNNLGYPLSVSKKKITLNSAAFFRGPVCSTVTLNSQKAFSKRHTRHCNTLSNNNPTAFRSMLMYVFDCQVTEGMLQEAHKTLQHPCNCCQ